MNNATPFLDAAIVTYADDVIERAQRNIGASRVIRGKRRRRVASGKLQNSLKYFVAKSKFKTVLDFTTTDDVDSYAGVIEFGRRKGARQPPVSAILDWMKEKNIRLQKKGGGFIKETPALRRSVAFLIARSIGKNGIEGIHYYRDAIESANEANPNLFSDAIKKEIETRTTLR